MEELAKIPGVWGMVRQRFISCFEGIPARSERHIAFIRLGISSISLLLVHFYLFEYAQTPRSYLDTILLIFTGWLFWSLLVIFRTRRGTSSKSVTAVSILFDIFIVVAIESVIALQIPLNFATGPNVSLYFVIIAMCAIRRNYCLVFLTGILCGLAHFVTTAYFYSQLSNDGYYLLELNRQFMELAQLDEVYVALSIVLFGGIVGYVTKELNRSERYYTDLFEHPPDGILIVSENRKILTANKKFTKMVGLENTDQIIGEPIENYLSQRPASFPRLDSGYSPKPYNATSLLHKEGRTVPTRTIIVPVAYQGVQCLELSIRDVTEQVKLERRLAEAQKMETVGKLARGLSHDFNNILGGILGATSLAQRILDSVENQTLRDKLFRHFEVIQDCGENAVEILDRLKTFSRKQSVKTESLDLLGLLSDVKDICQDSFPSNVSIQIEATDGTPVITKGDITSLTQAVLNLCINAKDAIGHATGDIFMRVWELDPGDLDKHPSLAIDYQYCCIEVKDDGCGMDKETLSQVFDPFFTTKDKGTGIGLSTVYNIALSHGGIVEASSQVGISSVFTLFIRSGIDSLIPPPEHM